MVEIIKTQYSLARRLLRFLAYILAGGTLTQALCCFAVTLFINDSQAAGMVANLLVQHLSYYFLGSAFVILSLSNSLIKRGVVTLRCIRLPSLILMLTVAAASFLLIPRMDYLRETALLDGTPVMLSPFASYFLILNTLVNALIIAQIASSILIAWRLSNTKLP